MATIEWEFTSEEIAAVREIVVDARDDGFVTERIDANVEGDAPTVTRRRFWDAHLAAQLTSQQRSGPDSPVTTFVRDHLADLSLQTCVDARDVRELVASRLEAHGGIRFYNTIGEACEANYERLFEEGGWNDVIARLESLQDLRDQEPHPSHADDERDVCRFLYDGVAGEGLHRIGPKQSRNLLQVLGLTRYETPLDSRISRWLNRSLDLPYHVSGGGLGQPEYYDFHADLVQAACREAGVLPCVFDAAVFASYDTGWTEADAGATF